MTPTPKLEAFEFRPINVGTSEQAILFKYQSDPHYTTIPIPDLAVPENHLEWHDVLLDKLAELGYVVNVPYQRQAPNTSTPTNA